MRRFGYPKRVESNKMILKWNAEGRKIKGRPSKQWTNGVRSVICKDLTEKDNGIEE